MKTARTLGLGLALITMAGVARAGEPMRTDINPALLYYQAFLLAPEAMPRADMDYLFSQPGRSGPLPERFGKLFTGYDLEFKLVRQAAHATVACDWGIDLSPGPAALLPGLARAKAVMQAARFRVMWELQHGRQTEACDDLLAAFALGRNLSRDHTLISALVQIAMEAIGSTTVAENFGRFSPESLQRLADGLDSLPAQGSVASTMATEKTFFQDWLRNRVADVKQKSAGDEAKAMESIRQLFVTVEGGDEEDAQQRANQKWQQVLRASGGTSDGILKMLADEDKYYDRLALIAALPYAEFEPQWLAFQDEVRQSGLAFPFLPPLDKARAREFKGEAMLTMVRAAIEYQLHGAAAFDAVQDPCGRGPFGLERFIFQGVDRGFKLTSGFHMFGDRVALIFAEGQGPAFRVDGPHAGEALPEPGAAK